MPPTRENQRANQIKKNKWENPDVLRFTDLRVTHHYYSNRMGSGN